MCGWKGVVFRLTFADMLDTCKVVSRCEDTNRKFDEAGWAAVFSSVEYSTLRRVYSVLGKPILLS